MADHRARLRKAARDYAKAAAAKDRADRERVDAAKAANTEAGMGTREIGEHLGVSHTIVSRLLRR